MDRTYCMTGFPFVILTHIEQHTARILGQSLSGLFDCDFAHPRARLVNYTKEIRRMLHECPDVPNEGRRLESSHDCSPATQQAENQCPRPYSTEPAAETIGSCCSDFNMKGFAQQSFA